MIVNEEVFGVIELACFEMIEDYKVKFVERLAETIASTISTVKVNQRTKVLLEKSQQASEQMRLKENMKCIVVSFSRITISFSTKRVMKPKHFISCIPIGP